MNKYTKKFYKLPEIVAIENTLGEIIFADRSEALGVVDSLRDIIDDYGVASVGDLYDLVGITGPFSHNKYGWTDVKNGTIIRVKYGYRLYLPKVGLIEDVLEQKTKADFIKPIEAHEYMGVEPVIFRIANRDIDFGPIGHITKETLQRTYLDCLGEEIACFGGTKKVASVRITVDEIELVLE